MLTTRHCACRTADGFFKGPVRLAYQPYFFSEGIIFFSHNKSANNIFQPDFSVKRTKGSFSECSKRRKGSFSERNK
jgi:hypothetical protein